MEKENSINIYASAGEHQELSNFAVRPFVAGVRDSSGGTRYFQFDSVEQAFQYAKTLSSRASEELLAPLRDEILDTVDGARLRELGASVPGLDRDRWDAVSPAMMEYFVRESFRQNPGAAEALLATGDALLTHTQDNTRWRTLFPQALMKVREEMRGVREAPREPSRQTEPSPGDPGLALRAADYDILTLGTGSRTAEEFRALIPEGTTVVVDARNYRKITRYPQFSDSNLVPALMEQGLRYEWMKNLSGKSRDRSFALAGNPREFDWEALSSSPDFRQGLEHLKELVALGERVVIISGEANPAFGHRALLLGQKLEAGGLSVGHIDTGPDGRPRVRSNRDVVEGALGHVAIEGGSYINVHFNSDRSYTVDDGVTLSRRAVDVPAGQRLIEGRWNYGTEVSFSEVDGPGTGPSALKDTYTENARYADVTVVFSIGTFDRAVRQAKTASEAKCVSVNVQKSVQHRMVDGDRERPAGDSTAFMTVKELLSDEQYIDKVAERLHDSIARNLAVRMAASPDLPLDPDSIILNIAGTDMAHIANEMVESAAPDDLTGQDIRTLEAGGLHPEVTSISQEEVDAFILGVLGRVQRMGREEGIAEGLGTPFTIGEIRTNGQTGVAEAATLAAQALGIQASVAAARGYGMTIDDETVKGQYCTDEAMFKNRFHQGLRNDVTAESLRTEVFSESMRRREDESLHLRPGLTDTQVLTLQLLGFGNTDIVDMTEYAEDAGVVIGSDADMMEFLLDCTSQGIHAEFVTVEAIAQKRGEASDLIFSANEQGIGFITVSSPDYPENLRHFQDIERMEYEERVVMDDIPEDRAARLLEGLTEDGVIHTDRLPVELMEKEEIAVERVPHIVRERRPAVLWYKGDRGLLNTPTASLHGNYTCIEETTGAAKALGERLAADGVTAVAPLRNGTAQVAMKETVDRGGAAIGFSTDSITGPDMDGIKEDIVRRGGLVLSERAPGDYSVDRRGMERAMVFSTALGYVSAFIDGFSRAQPLSPFMMAAYAVYGAVALAFRPFTGLDAALRTEGNREAAAHGMETATVGELGKVTQKARNAFGVGAGEVLSETRGFRPDDAKERRTADRETKHPRQCAVPVIRLGGESVYLVPENYPDVRRAVSEKAGHRCTFADPRDAETVYSRMLHRSAEHGGEKADGFAGYRGTQAMEKEPEMFTLYYVDGDIRTLLDAPDTTLGLLPQKQRHGNAVLFDRFRREAKAMQREMLSQAGLPSRREYRFENADYLVVKGSSVEVRRGDAVRAKVYLSADGDIRISNATTLGDDLQEHGRRQFPVFSSVKRMTGTPELEALLDDLRATLFDRSKAESEYLSPKSREEQEQMDREMAEGYMTVREDNMTVALSDVREAQRHGLVSDGLGRGIDAVTAMGMLLREKDVAERRVGALARELEKTQKAIERTTAKGVFDSTVPSDGQTAESEERQAQKEALKEELEALEEKAEAIEGSLVRDMARARYLGSHLRDAAYASQFAVVTDGEGAGRLEIEGLLIPVSSTASLSETQMENARKQLEKCSQPRQAPAVTREAKPVRGTAEVQLPEDVHVARVEGGRAFMDDNERVIGETYSDIKRGRGFFAGFNDEGRFRIIRPDGTPVSREWFDGISEPVEGVSVVRSGRNYNLLDIAGGRMLSDGWLQKAGAPHDGWSLVQNGGKYNYMDARGTLMTDRWFDSATEFRDGVATIRRSGTEARIDKGGAITEVLNRGEAKGVQMT